MAEKLWWEAVTPHKDIQEQRVNEALFAANLGLAVQGEGPSEYSDAKTFFQKTYLSKGLCELLDMILKRVDGDKGQNAVAILQTSFGGGKTHSELAVYHLLSSPAEAMSVPQVASFVQSTGLDGPPPCRVAVIAGSSLNPLGRTTSDGCHIHTLWGEMAYQLGGREAFQLLAETDAKLVSPGDELLARVLERAGPSVILFDETLHYVDKVWRLKGEERNLATQTVAFLRELTDATNSVPGSMMVVSLTASHTDQLSPQAMEWLGRLNEHVIREAAKKTPIERTEIHEVVRQRLFEHVDDQVALEVAQRYRQLYAHLGGLPADKTGDSYQRLMERSYPFHPELISILYERWGSKPGFQLTRDTLRFLALALQNLWRDRQNVTADLIQCLDIDLSDSNLRGMIREVAGDPQWEAVVGSDVAGQSGTEPAKAQLVDQRRNDGAKLAEGLATTILMYSLGGGEAPYASRDGLRLACARPEVPEAMWDDMLRRFERDLFYYYFDDGRHRFRKEPNVMSLHHANKANLEDSEIDAYMHRILSGHALGDKPSAHGFQVYFRPEDSQAVRDDEEIKLVIPDPTLTVRDGAATESTLGFCLGVLEKRGQVLRQNRNTIVFCVADAETIALARTIVADYLSWRKIQRNESDWDRIGGAQQSLVSERLSDTEGSSIRGLVSAYTWALVPTQDSQTGQLALKTIRLGPYGPGKLIVPMVWERLTAEGSVHQSVLRTLTPDTFLQRYGSYAWPTSEVWVTTAQLWDRFTRLVGLPMLENRQVLLDTLKLGQREGLFAIGHLADEENPRDERDSYLALFFQDAAPPPQVPMVGERWLLLRESMYQQIAHQPIQVTPEEVLQAIVELNGEGQPVRVESLYNYVSKGKPGVDEESFVSSLAEVIDEQGVAYRTTFDAPDTKAVPQSLDELKSGIVVIPKASHVEPATGRTVTVSGTLGTLSELGPLYKNVLQPLVSQNPTEISISVNVRAQYDKDPGAGLTATLADGFDKDAFPGLRLTDSGEEKH